MKVRVVNVAEVVKVKVTSSEILKCQSVSQSVSDRPRVGKELPGQQKTCSPVADALYLSPLNMQHKIPNWVLVHFGLCLGLAG